MRSLITLLFPPVCVGCRKTLRAGALCDRCRATLRVQSAPVCPHCDRRIPGGNLPKRCRDVLRIRKLAVAFSYEHPMAKAAVDALKYEGLYDLAAPLGEAAADAVRRQWGNAPNQSILVPVPLHPKRLQERGFNQATRIAEVAGSELDVPVADHIVARTMHTKAQVGLGSEERKENVIGAFQAMKPDQKKIYILVDDVTTTGSTIRAAAAALRKAGARNVSAVTVAQG